MSEYITHAKMYNYADDNLITHSSKSYSDIECTLTAELNKMIVWFKGNGFEANPNKFQCMVLSPNKNIPPSLSIVINNSAIPVVQCIKTLGINIDNKLVFDLHIESMCKRAGRQINVLHRLNANLDYTSRLIIYKSFIQSLFLDCPVVWMFTQRKYLKMLQRIQEKALRSVCKENVSSYIQLLCQCNVPSIYLLLLRSLVTEVFKCVNNMNADYLNTIFDVKVSKYEMRNSVLLVQPRVKTIKYGLRSFTYCGAKIWNGLPCKYKNILTLSEFKDQIKSWNGPECSCNICMSFCL